MALGRIGKITCLVFFPFGENAFTEIQFILHTLYPF